MSTLEVQVSSINPDNPTLSNEGNGKQNTCVIVLSWKTYALIQVAGACINNYFDTGFIGAEVLQQTPMFAVMGEGGEWATGRLSIVKATSNTITWIAGTNSGQKRRFGVIRLDWS